MYNQGSRITRPDPGNEVLWRAPDVPGAHQIRVQIVTDLGKRRVGLLAERATEIDVRQCAKGETQAGAKLRIETSRRGPYLVRLFAVHSRELEFVEYRWQFGDRAALTTKGRATEHRYDLSMLNKNEQRSFRISLVARDSDGKTMSATTHLFMRKGPPSRAKMAIEVSKWSWNQADKRWQSKLRVENTKYADITWERLDRVIEYFDGHLESHTYAWDKVVHVEQKLNGGGFVGFVTVDAKLVPPDVKKILDRLFGRDAKGEQVVLMWTPFKRAAPKPDPDTYEPPLPPPPKQ